MSVYRSYQIDVHIKDFEQQNEKIAIENKEKAEDYAYYSSDAYIEKMAKQNLGLVNFGEEVIVIPKTDAGRSGIVGNLEDGQMDDNNAVISMSNEALWWNFFFDRSIKTP